MNKVNHFYRKKISSGSLEPPCFISKNCPRSQFQLMITEVANFLQTRVKMYLSSSSPCAFWCIWMCSPWCLVCRPQTAAFVGQTASGWSSGHVNVVRSPVVLRRRADSCLIRAESAQSPDCLDHLSMYQPDWGRKKTHTHTEGEKVIITMLLQGIIVSSYAIVCGSIFAVCWSSLILYILFWRTKLT